MKIKFIFKQTIREGEIVPLHLGIAYPRIITDEAVCYLVPIHLVVRVVRIAWIKLRMSTWTRFEKQYLDEIRYIRKKALEEGLRRGFVDGYLVKSMDAPIPLKYQKAISDATVRLQQHFQRGLRKDI